MDSVIYWLIIAIVVGAPVAIVWQKYDLWRRTREIQRRAIELRLREGRPPMPGDNDNNLYR